MPFIIDVDHIKDPNAQPGTNQNAVGVMGPSDYTGDGSELKQKFRLYDDDNVLYYEGRMRDDVLEATEELAFEPLDCFGDPNAGCTRMDYLSSKTGKWETV